MLVKFVLAATMVVFAIMWMVFPSHSDAMKNCQKTHSYETCFHTLNR